MLFSLLLALLTTIAALIFAFQNAAPARVSFLAWQFESPLALVLLISFGGGLLAGALLLLPGRIRAGLAAAGQKRELAALNRKLAECEGKLEEAETRLGSAGPAQSPGAPGPSRSG
jgi:uncharacterized integral membrane protein